MHDQKKIQVALVGNPNCGKTTLFNGLTGSNQRVANYPGVTVEVKMGSTHWEGVDFTIIDLPGTYALSSQSEDESIVADHLISNKPDVILNVLDATNLERNLILTTHLMEFDIPMLIILNMTDEVEKLGFSIDTEKIAALLGLPVLKTVATKKVGIDRIKQNILDLVVKQEGRSASTHNQTLQYGEVIQKELEALDLHASTLMIPTGKSAPIRWLALKGLENDVVFHRILSSLGERWAVFGTLVSYAREKIEKRLAPRTLRDTIQEKRWGYVRGITKETVESNPEKRHEQSTKIDGILTHRVLGIPIFLVIMWSIFQITFWLGDPMMTLIEGGVTELGSLFRLILPEGFLQSLLVDGIIGGIGSVIVFLPNILLLFLCLSFLEDIGYTPRIVFILDKLMHKIGLHGHSFIPMVTGFGCAIPGIMAARAMNSPADRLTTILVLPFMSCGARFPVYVLFIGAFFSESASGNVLFSIYMIGILAAIFFARLFRSTVFKGKSFPLVMELPPYRFPTLKAVFWQTWFRGWLYLKKAGTIILAISVVIWLLANIHLGGGEQAIVEQDKQTESSALVDAVAVAEDKVEENNASPSPLKDTLLGRIGSGVSVILEPVGLGDWRVGVALTAGFAAKEVVVSTMGILYSIDEADEESQELREQLQNDPFYTPFIAYIFMLFVLLYVPCMSTIAVIKKETGKWQWALLSMSYPTLFAWLVCFVVYQVGSLFGAV